jgi:hypothetical protein
MPPAKPREGIAQLQLEEHAKCGIAFSPSTSLEDDSETGKLWTDSLKRVKDTEIGPEGAFPAALMPPLPLASASGSGENIHVEERKMLDLTPGVYGALVIEEHGTLRLAAGRYTFTSVKMEEDSKLLGVRGKDEKRDAANGERASSLEVHIVNGLQMEDEAKIAPDWDDARAKDFLIYVAGTDPAKIEHPASAPPYVRLTPTTVVSIGKKAKIHGLLAAPHGTIWMADGSGGKGAFAGFDIKLAEEVEVEFQDGFSASAPGQQGSQQLHGYFSIGPDPSIGPIAGPVEPDTLIPLAIGLPVRAEDIRKAGVGPGESELSAVSLATPVHSHLLAEFRRLCEPAELGDHERVYDQFHLCRQSAAERGRDGRADSTGPARKSCVQAAQGWEQVCCLGSRSVA